MGIEYGYAAIKRRVLRTPCFSALLPLRPVTYVLTRFHSRPSQREAPVMPAFSHSSSFAECQHHTKEGIL